MQAWNMWYNSILISDFFFIGKNFTIPNLMYSDTNVSLTLSSVKNTT
jgi:hypothetical protein